DHFVEQGDDCAAGRRRVRSTIQLPSNVVWKHRAIISEKAEEPGEEGVIRPRRLGIREVSNRVLGNVATDGDVLESEPPILLHPDEPPTHSLDRLLIERRAGVAIQVSRHFLVHEVQSPTDLVDTIMRRQAYYRNKNGSVKYMK